MKNILLIAYYFSPDKRVGALRASYWFDELSSVMDANVHVITAETEATGRNVHVIRESSRGKGSGLVLDPGITWRSDIIEFMKKKGVGTAPDIIILTGGPFMHFSLGKWFKKMYGSKIILDYRDPFADNPIFRNSGLKKLVKRFYEKSFNRECDAIVTVNRQCASLIGGFHNKKNAIIENGFDERVSVIPHEIERGSHNFIYAGKFYFDPSPLQQALSERGKGFIYMGGNGGELDNQISGFNDLGFLSYPASVDEMNKADVGVLQIAGAFHQSTTKVFDYIRCSLRILVVSEQELGDCAILDILDGFPNVHFAINDAGSLSEAISEIEQSQYIQPDRQFILSYSRSDQLKKLVDLIHDLD